MPLPLALLGALWVSQAPPSDPNAGLAELGLKVVQPMAPEEVARTRARVDAEIARSGAPAGVLENVTDANGGRVRHAASRLTCALGATGQSVRSSGADQVACQYLNGGTLHRLSAVRAPAGATLVTVADAALAEARREPGFAFTAGSHAEGHPQPGSGLPDHRTLVFQSRVDGRERWSRLLVGLVDGWVLTERSLAPSPPQAFDFSVLISEATFGSQMRPPKPATPPAAP